jgi:uncharacterized protein (UPF0335 family)
MWISKEKYEAILDRIDCLEKEVKSLNVDSKIFVFSDNLTRGILWNLQQSKNYSVKEVLQKIIKFLDLKISFTEKQESLEITQNKMGKK